MPLTGEIQVGVSGFFNYLFVVFFSYSNVLVRKAEEDRICAVLEEALNGYSAVLYP